MDDQAILMEEPKQKLMVLKELIPDTPYKLLYEFGKYLATSDCLNPRLTPKGFVLACELALYDLQVGNCTGNSIHDRLIGYSPIIYDTLSTEIPNIAEAIFPAEFSIKVRNHIERIRGKIQVEQATK